MRKNLIKIAAISSLILGGFTTFPNVAAVQLEEGVKIIPNTVDDIMITRIAPYIPWMELEYHATNLAYSGNDNNETPFRITVAYGNFTDKDIYDINDYSTIMAQEFPDEVGAVMVTKGDIDSFKPGGLRDGQILDLFSYRISSWSNLVEGSDGRLIYRISFTSGAILVGRVDYTRCIHSSVFLSGEATECRMEYLANNKVQYQPYTEDGTRVEIPAEEDAILTAATEAWDPPYGWPDLPSEPEPAEPEPEPEPEPDLEPEPAESEPELEPDPEFEPAAIELEPVEPEPVVEPEVVLAGVKTDETEAIKIENNEVPEKEIKMTEVIDEMSTGTGAESSGMTTSETSSTNIAAEGTEKVKSGDSLEYGEADMADTTGTIGSEVKEVAAATNNKQDEVEVPELGQETGKKPNIAVSIAIIAGVGAALVAAWWFLFLGRHKSKEEKEGKE